MALYLTSVPVVSPVPIPRKIVSFVVSTTGTEVVASGIVRCPILAPTVRPPLLITVPLPMVAWFVTLATFTATPNPTPVPLPLVVAAPDAIAWPFTCATVVTDSIPAVVIDTPSATEAFAVPSSTFTATAPATLTDPLPDCALLLLSDPFVPMALELLFLTSESP